MLRAAVLGIAVVLSCGSAAWSDGRFRNLMPYDDAREMLQHLGYEPYAMPGADICDPNDPRCFPELDRCAHGRSWACTYTWRRGRSIIEVGTQYDHPVVTRSQCIVNCGRRFDPPPPARAASTEPESD